MLTNVEIATTFRSRTKGLLGTTAPAATSPPAASNPPAALLLMPAKAIHTLGMKYAINVAYLRRIPAVPCPLTDQCLPAPGDLTFQVLATTTMAPGRIGRPRWRCHAVLEAPVLETPVLETPVLDSSVQTNPVPISPVPDNSVPEAPARTFARWQLAAGDEVRITGQNTV